MTSLLQVDPLHLRFSSAIGATQEVRLTLPPHPNPSHTDAPSHSSTIAFKLQTNASHAFTVKPVYGYLSCGEEAKVTIRLNQVDAEDAAKPKKIMIRAIDVSHLLPHLPPVKHFWRDSPAGATQKILLTCSFVSSIPPSPSPSADHLNLSNPNPNPNPNDNPNANPITNPNLKLPSSRFASKSTTELLLQGAEELKDEAIQHAVETFSFVLSRLKSSPADPMRAEALIGLGEAYSKSGLQNRALDCYKAAIPIARSAKDIPGAVRVMGMVAALYAEMHLSAQSAAWYDQQIKELDLLRSPSLSSRRAALVLARDIQLRSVSKAEYHAAVEQILKEQPGSTGASVDVKEASSSVSSKMSALWEPPEASVAQELPQNGHVRASGAESEIRPAARPARQVAKVDEGSRLLVPTVASQRWRAASKESAGKKANGSNGATASARQASAGRRSSASSHSQRVYGARGATARPSPPSTSSTICVLRLNCVFNKQRLKLVLPGPRKAKNLTVREVREKASFVCGIPVQDFQLAVSNMPLSDAWFCSDCGIHNDCTIDLTLLPGVDPKQYHAPPPSATSREVAKSEKSIRGRNTQSAASAVPLAPRAGVVKLSKAKNHRGVERSKQGDSTGRNGSATDAVKSDLLRRLDLAQVYIETAAVEQEAARLKAAEISDRIQALLTFASSTSEQPSPPPSNPPDVAKILDMERDIRAEEASHSQAAGMLTSLASSLSSSDSSRALPAGKSGDGASDLSVCIVVMTPESDDLLLENNCIVSKVTGDRWAFSVTAGPIEFEEFLLGFPDHFLPMSALDQAQFWFSFGPISPLRQCGYDAITRYAKHVYANTGVVVEMQAMEVSKQTGKIRDLLHVPSAEKRRHQVRIEEDSKGLVLQGATSVRLSGFREFLLLRKRIKGKVIAAQGHVLFAMRIIGLQTDRTFVYVDVEPSLTSDFVKDWRSGASQAPFQNVIRAAKRSAKFVLCPVVTTELNDAVEEALSLFVAEPGK